jgi:hypothetical protein
VNILQARVVLRERSLLDVVDLAVRFVVTHGKAYGRLSLATLPAAFAVSLLVAHTLGWGWAWTIALLLGPFIAAPFTGLASRLLFEPTARTGEVLRATLSATPRLALVRAAELLGMLVSGILVLPAFWLLSVFLFANEVVVLERAGASSAITRMQRLLSGSAGDAILAALFLLALHIVAVFLGDFVGRSALEDLLEITAPPSITDGQGSVLGIAAYWAFVPYLATCRFLLYVNVRTRAEGWDVQTRFAAIAVRAQQDGRPSIPGALRGGATGPRGGAAA